MYYGVSYYPEHKSREELQWDIRLLKESGINTVRMGEFAWSRMEPREGVYEFDWLDEVIDELSEAGIKTIVCTPTACPPSWIMFRYPDLNYQDNRRIKRPFGGRRHYCYNHEVYRRHCVSIAEEIGKRYGNHPFVAGFQIDNEPAQEGTGRCTCPTCEQKFQEWLRQKYLTIEAFNKRSGAVFWSMEYEDFSQITPPVNGIEVGTQTQIQAFYENPTVRLEFERFSSESQIAFQDLQTHALKKYTVYPVTTNATGLATNSIDYYKSTKELDCYAFDYYPGLRDTSVDSYPYAFARGVKEGKPFWVLEFMSGGGHRLSGSGRLQPNPGALKQAVIQSFAHGAQAMLHFQFRSFPIGAEQLNYAIVDLDGKPRRRYFEMQETAELLRRLEPLSAAEFQKEAAIVFDYDSHWALRIKPVNDPDFHYVSYGQKMYHRLSQMGISTDVISLDQDFSGYKLLILPAAFVLTRKQQEKIKAYASQGGIVVASFLTSVKNEDNVGYTDSLPAGLTEMFGICVEEVEPVFEQNQTGLKIQWAGEQPQISRDSMMSESQTASDSMMSEAQTGKDSLWSELLTGSAKSLGWYTESYKQGSMVISGNSYGKGYAYYTGTELTEKTWEFLLEKICQTHGIVLPLQKVPEGVEVVRRILSDRTVEFYFNFTGHSQEIPLAEEKEDYFSGEKTTKLIMEQNGFAVLW